MLSTTASLPPINRPPIFVWVLAPQLVTADENLDYYYDFSQSIEEYTRCFKTLGLPWKWQPVSLDNYADVIATIAAGSNGIFPVVLNLCDGDEVNGAPGISIVKLLEEKGLVYTGADAFFYHITTSKTDMKRAFDNAGVPTPRWVSLEENRPDAEGIFEKLGNPIILKPAISGGSMGVGVKSVVSNAAEFNTQLQHLYEGYRGWSLTAGGVIAESFIDGPEFTTFITGSYDEPGTCKVYPPVERVFHPSLPDREKFLSFDRLWEIYEDEESMPNEENFYEYQVPDVMLVSEIKKLSMEAYVATCGRGYTRVDLRMDKATGRMYVLEVNAQCGISEDENFTSIGAILRLAGLSFSDTILEIIHDAFTRHATPGQQLKTTAHP
ncbi:MAG: hypothetical protein ABIX01_15665 [Chitinophagaceae bacterium]